MYFTSRPARQFVMIYSSEWAKEKAVSNKRSFNEKRPKFWFQTVHHKQKQNTIDKHRFFWKRLECLSLLFFYDSITFYGRYTKGKRIVYITLRYSIFNQKLGTRNIFYLIMECQRLKTIDWFKCKYKWKNEIANGNIFVLFSRTRCVYLDER